MAVTPIPIGPMPPPSLTLVLSSSSKIRHNWVKIGHSSCPLEEHHFSSLSPRSTPSSDSSASLLHSPTHPLSLSKTFPSYFPSISLKTHFFLSKHNCTFFVVSIHIIDFYFFHQARLPIRATETDANNVKPKHRLIHQQAEVQASTSLSEIKELRKKR